MAVIRKDMFGDGRVSMEYYPHKRIELRVCNFKINVCKPYGSEQYGYTYPNPLIQMSSNSTVHLAYTDLQLIENAIIKAIEILNNENDGLIIDRQYKLSNNYIKLADIPQQVKALHEEGKQKTKTKSIPYKEITPNYVYADIKGHKWIYLGKGRLYENSDCRYSINRVGCYEVYLDFDSIEGCQVLLQNGTLKIIGNTGYCTIDTYSTRKRFIQRLNKIGEGNILNIVLQNESYRFTPIR